MPNSIELRLVIQTSTMNSAHCDALADFAGLAVLLLAGGAVRALFSARSRTSALASRAASAAAASASSSTVLLPSAMMRLLGEAPGRGTDGANQFGDVSTAPGPREWPAASKTQGCASAPSRTTSGAGTTARCVARGPGVVSSLRSTQPTCGGRRSASCREGAAWRAGPGVGWVKRAQTQRYTGTGRVGSSL